MHRPAPSLKKRLRRLVAKLNPAGAHSRLGLSVYDGGIVVARARKGNSPVLESVVHETFPTGTPQTSPLFLKTARRALARAAVDIKRCELWAAGPADTCDLYMLRIPMARSSELDAVALLSAKKEKDFNPATSTFDYRITEEVTEKNAPKLAMLGVRMDSSSLSEAKNRYERMGVRPFGITSQGLCGWNFYASGWLQNPWNRFALISFEEDATSCSLISGKSLMMRRTLRTGVRQLCEALEWLRDVDAQTPDHSDPVEEPAAPPPSYSGGFSNTPVYSIDDEPVSSNAGSSTDMGSAGTELLDWQLAAPSDASPCQPLGQDPFLSSSGPAPSPAPRNAVRNPFAAPAGPMKIMDLNAPGPEGETAGKSSRLTPGKEPGQAAGAPRDIAAIMRGLQPRTPEETKALSGVLRRMARQVERTIAYFRNTVDASGIEGIVVRAPLGVADLIVEELSQENDIPCMSMRLDGRAAPGVLEEIERLRHKGVETAVYRAVDFAFSSELTPNLLMTYRERRLASLHSIIGVSASALALILCLSSLAFCLKAFIDWRAAESRLAAALEAQKNWKEPVSSAVLRKEMSSLRALHDRGVRVAERRIAAAAVSEITIAAEGNVTILSLNIVPSSGAQPSRRSNSKDKDADKPSAAVIIKGAVTGTDIERETTLADFFSRLEHSPIFRSLTVTKEPSAGSVSVFTATLRVSS